MSEAIEPVRHNETIMTIPACGSLKTARLDLTMVYAAERRIPEIQLVKRETAGGLLAELMQGYGQANQAFALVIKLLTDTENAVKRRRAMLLLDVVPDKLREKGLATTKNPTGSEDLRNAIIEQDEEYAELQDRKGLLDATRLLIDGKRKNLDMAYTAIKKIISPDSGMSWRPDTSHGEIPDGTQAGDTLGFGNPRYRNGR